MAYLAQAGHPPVPFSVTFEITKRCNLKCLHCYRVEEPDRQELSTEEAKDVLDQLRALGAFTVYFTGGEVFTRNDFLEVVAHARARSLSVTIASNAHFITPEVAAEIKRRDVMSVAISLYGRRAETHDRMTKQPGSWEATMRGARAAVESGLVTIFRIVVTHFNHEEVESMIALCKEMGIYHRLFPYMTPRTNGSLDPVALQAERSIAAKFIRLNLDGATLPSLGKPPDPDQRGIRCGVSWSSCTIGPYGDVLPCLTMEFSAGNVRQEPLGAIWNDSPVFTTLRSLKASDFGSCFSCDVRSRCNSCIGKAYMENGTIFEPAGLTHCPQTKLRNDLYEELRGNAYVCPAHPPETH